MQKEHDLDKLEELAKADVSDDAHTMLPGTTVLALVAECRELRRLKWALEFLDVHARIDLVGQARHLPCAPQNVTALATELGWEEGT